MLIFQNKVKVVFAEIKNNFVKKITLVSIKRLIFSMKYNRIMITANYYANKNNFLIIFNFISLLKIHKRPANFYQITKPRISCLLAK